MKKIIVFRLSAMGDVSLTIPVIRGVMASNPDIEMTVVTRKFFAPFFYGIPGVKLFFPNLAGRHKGLFGLIRLYYDLKKEGPFTSVIDLHGVIRTKILTALFKLSGMPAYSIDKGRKEKRFILKAKYIRTLKHSTTRYLDTFNAAGFKGQIGRAPFIEFPEEATAKVDQFLSGKALNDRKIRIGLAPFATHKPKIWGINKFRELISEINNKYDVDFFLFGGGEEEIKNLKELEKYSPNIHLVAGNLNLTEELSLIRMLDLMISMDSSNMHLSALMGIPTVSIWGGTHPAFGFSPLGQPSDYQIQTRASSLKCRPCSVFGGKACIYPEPKCMEMIKSQDVFRTLEKFNLLKIRDKGRSVILEK